MHKVLIRMTIWLTACLIAGCSRGPKEPEKPLALVKMPASQAPKNLILITLDTWRFDASGFSGSKQVRTPHFDELARQGVVCERTYAQAVVTLPSHASILTGLYPHQHGLRDNAGFRLDPKIDTLARRLKQAGFATGAFVSAFPLDSRYGLNADFDRYDDSVEAFIDNTVTKIHERPGKSTIEAALAWYRQQSGSRFLWLHLYEPHFPYAPPEPFAAEYRKNPYHGEVAYADQLLAEVFAEARKQADQTTLVLTSDHGEGLGEHGELTHGVFAYDPTLRVPLVLWSPGQLAPTRISQIVRHVDLVPTLLDLFNLPKSANLPGRSLFSASVNTAQQPAPASTGPAAGDSYFESLSTYLNRGWAPLRGCVKGKYKAIDLPIPELYDLESDPGESKNLASEQAELWRECLECLPDAPLTRPDRQLGDEEVEKLQALGYAAAEGQDLSGKAADPKNQIALDHKLQRAFGLGGQGRYAEAIPLLEEIIAADPRIEIAYQYMSDFHAASGRPDLAIAILRKAVAREVRGEETLRKLALLLVQSGEAREALSLLAPLDNSQDPDTQSAFGKALTALGQFEPARLRFERALQLDATNPEVWSDLGTLWLYAQKPQNAEQAFRKCLAENPRDAIAWNGLGILHARAGRLDEAIESWELAIRYDPSLAYAFSNLAKLYESKGNRSRAAELLEAYAAKVPQPERQRALAKAQQLRNASL